MNIRISYNWLRDYLETDASPYDLAKYLSLSGPSFERVEKTGNDYEMEIEITSNRIDTASVFGIAQEAKAILPMFGKKAKIKLNPFKKYRLANLKNNLKGNYPLNIDIQDDNLCSRFTAVVIDNVKIFSSPKLIRDRLAIAGIKSINNVVDISNYLMISLGQPVHTFDYDKVKGNKMIMRNSKKGEKIITLDGKGIILPGMDIVIEDGSGRLIDLCGIMGGKNSAIDKKTKRVILFVQTYNKKKVRRTTMITGQRTVAVTYFEKGLDEERVEATLVYGINLLEKYAQGKIASRLYDIYPHPYQGKKITISYQKINQTMGVPLEKKLVKNILVNLGFKINEDNLKVISVSVPFYRKNDINIKEDIVEEVARIYGYHNIPGKLSPPVFVEQPQDFEKLFMVERKTKFFLKHLGLNEMKNYSMVSEELLNDFKINFRKNLRLDNTISKEIEYMRTTLIPSLYKNIKSNSGKKETMRFFELAKVYHPRPNDLPKEIYRLGIGTNTNFFDLKGIFEALFRELNIRKKITVNYLEKEGVYLAEINLDDLIKNYNLLPLYKALNPYAVIKLDLTIDVFKNGKILSFEEIKKISLTASPLLEKLEVLDKYKTKLSIRYYFSSREKNITEEEAKKELEKIKILL